MAQPDIKLVIKRPKSTANGTVWLTVGDVALWRGPDGFYSGKCQIPALGEFDVFDNAKPAPNRQESK